MRFFFYYYLFIYFIQNVLPLLGRRITSTAESLELCPTRKLPGNTSSVCLGCGNEQRELLVVVVGKVLAVMDG